VVFPPTHFLSSAFSKISGFAIRHLEEKADLLKELEKKKEGPFPLVSGLS